MQYIDRNGHVHISDFELKVIEARKNGTLKNLPVHSGGEVVKKIQYLIDIDMWEFAIPCIEIRKAVDDIRKIEGSVSTWDIDVIDGVLYVNGTGYKRIAPKSPREPFNPREYYWEGRILARQEAAYD